MGLPALLTFEGQEVRVVDKNGDPWWILADVCRVLEIGNPAQAATRLDPDEKGLTTNETLGGPQDLTIVSEPGLYNLIQTSRKPIAKRFDRWVRHEVLPSIRKIGGYGNFIPAVLEQMSIRFDHQDKRMDHQDRELAELRKEVAKVITFTPRKDFHRGTKKLYIDVIRQRYFGCDPLDHRTKILDEKGDPIKDVFSLDHFFGPGDVRVEAGWPVSSDNNQKLRDPKVRNDARPHFDVFHRLRRELFGNHKTIKSARKARIKSNKKRCPRTPDLFNG